MKKAFALTTVLAVIVLAMGANAAGPLRMRIEVPFAFSAGNAQLPAGEYIVDIQGMSPYSATGSSVVIRESKGAAAVVLFAMPLGRPGTTETASVVFNKYGQAYFLTEVRQPMLEVGVAKSKAEKEASLAYGVRGGEPRILQARVIR